jgi:Protein SCAI
MKSNRAWAGLVSIGKCMLLLSKLDSDEITDFSYVQFFGDDFLRTLILRFVFCDVALRLHRGFRGRHQRPRCEPPLPGPELLEHPSLAHIILQLATHLDVRGHFSEAPVEPVMLDWCCENLAQIVMVAMSILVKVEVFRNLQVLINFMQLTTAVWNALFYCVFHHLKSGWIRVVLFKLNFRYNLEKYY